MFLVRRKSMAVKKKRASFSKAPHIAVSAVVPNLEDVEEVPEAAIELPPVPQIAPESEESLVEMLSENVEDSALSKKNVWIYRFGLMITCTIIASAIGLYLLFVSQSKAPVSTVATVSTPTPVPTVVVDMKSITIEVLNGSGVSGKAQKTASALQAKGYTIVSTGNAKKIPVSTVQFSPQVSKQAIDSLLLELKEHNISSVSSVPLTSSVSARIILGLK